MRHCGTRRPPHPPPLALTPLGERMETPPDLIDFTAGGARSGDLEVAWIHGSESAKHNTDPDIQVHAYDEHTFILRQNMAVNYEAPFMFLLFGNARAVLIDTGATASADFFPLRRVVDGLVDGLARRPSPRRLRSPCPPHPPAWRPCRRRCPVRRPSRHRSGGRGPGQCLGILRIHGRRRPGRSATERRRRSARAGGPRRARPGMLAQPGAPQRGRHVLRSPHRVPAHRRHGLSRPALHPGLASVCAAPSTG